MIVSILNNENTVALSIFTKGAMMVGENFILLVMM